MKRGRHLISDGQKQVSFSDALTTLLCCVDDICEAQMGGRKIRHTFWKDLVAAILAADATTLSDLEKFLKEDTELPKIRRTFKDYDSKVGTLSALLGSTPTVSSLLFTVVSLSSFAAHEDLQSDVVTLGALIVKKKAVMDIVTCVELLRQKKKMLPRYFSAFSRLRDMCQTYSLAGSLRSLPMVTLSMSENDSDFKEIVSALSRYEVFRDVEKLQKEVQQQFDEILDDIVDIFNDYSRGKLRVEALKKLSSVANNVVKSIP